MSHSHLSFQMRSEGEVNVLHRSFVFLHVKINSRKGGGKVNKTMSILHQIGIKITSKQRENDVRMESG